MAVNIKHNKLKNTGIIFELCIHQIVSDTLSGKESKILPILREFFVKTELGREYKLYEIISNKRNLTEGKSEMIISSLVESSKNLNKEVLNRQKYNLIKRISENYNIEEFFKTKSPNYKLYASLYTLLEIYNGNKIDPNQLISNKSYILEHLTSNYTNVKKIEEGVMEEFKAYDKDTRILTYRILIENFNKKYNDLNSIQKSILKEFINIVDNPVKLKIFYNSKLNEIKQELEKYNKKVEDKATHIKINEVNKLLTELDKNEKINNDHLVNLLQYGELLQEIKDLK